MYLSNAEGKEVGKRRNVPLCPKAGTPKWQAEQMLHALILNETGVPAKTSPGNFLAHNVDDLWSLPSNAAQNFETSYFNQTIPRFAVMMHEAHSKPPPPGYDAVREHHR